MNRRRLLLRLSQGHLHNVAFSDFQDLVAGFRFEIVRVQGSHHVYRHPRIAEQLNLQEWHGEAKPYQLRQFMWLVERYDLRLEDEE